MLATQEINKSSLEIELDLLINKILTILFFDPETNSFFDRTEERKNVLEELLGSKGSENL